MAIIIIKITLEYIARKDFKTAVLGNPEKKSQQLLPISGDDSIYLVLRSHTYVFLL